LVAAVLPSPVAVVVVLVLFRPILPAGHRFPCLVPVGEELPARGRRPRGRPGGIRETRRRVRRRAWLVRDRELRGAPGTAGGAPRGQPFARARRRPTPGAERDGHESDPRAGDGGQWVIAQPPRQGTPLQPEVTRPVQFFAHRPRRPAPYN